MKKYNVSNYIRYKTDLQRSMPDHKRTYDLYTRDELIIKFLPLVENMAHKFATTQQASGILDITDLIQEGSKGLIAAVDKIEMSKIIDSEDPEKTIKSFLSKRIKGAIRRSIDITRGHIRIPEHKLNEMRQNPQDKKIVEIFFNSIFLSIDEQAENEENYFDQVPDRSEPYNLGLLNIYLKGILKKNLNPKEYEVLRLSYGLDCDKHSANEIAKIIGIEGPSSYVRVSEIKKMAIQKLIDNVDSSQVIDYL
jgi:RNA polymerase sigma factor (sigma-70 family)|tara:strand:+ start:495 stop:1247 length:753 start_codon:yes stop_codon:yes gene_type:complete